MYHWSFGGVLDYFNSLLFCRLELQPGTGKFAGINFGEIIDYGKKTKLWR